MDEDKRPSDQSTFQTPEEIAARDEQATATPLLSNQENKLETDDMPKKNKSKWRPTKKQVLIGLAILIVIVVAGYFIYLHFWGNKDTSLSLPFAAIVSTTVPSRLTGLQVNPSLNKLPVTAVMIENSLEARPQSGLGQAGVVFEALAEGGITRFMALYQNNTTPSNIGPVRSARPYFLQWALGFDPAYVHVGGSTQAESDISSWGVRDLDQRYNGNYFHRISSRQAPHNVYTSMSELTQLEDSKGYTSSKFTSWLRKPADPAKVPTVNNISLSLSGPDYNVTYAYDSKTNSYNRSEGGSPQIDANTNNQISPQVVIAIVVPESQGALDTSGAYYSDYSVIGSGTAYIFQDGGVSVGQWTKSSNTSQIIFTTSGGKSIALIPGQTWITAVTNSSAVTYSK